LNVVPIERRRLRTSRKSKMVLEAYREKEAEDQRERGRVGGVCANNPLVEED
jgi:hypothetical protein